MSKVFLDTLKYDLSNSNNVMTHEDMEYYKIAIKRSLDYAQNISGGSGPKFKTVEQRERYEKLLKIYNKYARIFIYKAKLTGKELEVYTIRKILEEQENLRNKQSSGNELVDEYLLSYVDRMILQSHLPRMQEQGERI